MNTPTLETERLLLRKFTEQDMEALFLILKDEEVNKFLTWYPMNNIEETKKFMRRGMLQNMRSHKVTHKCRFQLQAFASLLSVLICGYLAFPRYAHIQSLNGSYVPTC